MMNLRQLAPHRARTAFLADWNARLRRAAEAMMPVAKADVVLSLKHKERT